MNPRYEEFRWEHPDMILTLTLEEASEYLTMKKGTLDARWRNTRRPSNSLKNGRQKTLPSGVEAGLNTDRERVIIGQRRVLDLWRAHIVSNRDEEEDVEEPIEVLDVLFYV